MYHIYSNVRQGFSLNMTLKICEAILKFTYEVLNWMAPNWIIVKCTMQCQTKACSTKSSSEICALVRYYAV